MGDLGAGVGSWIELERAFVSGENAIDGDVSIGVAVEADVGTMNAFDPGVEVLLGLGEIAIVGRRNVFEGRADGHGALRERTIDSVLRGSAKRDVFVAEAGFDAVVDHGFEQLAVRLVADTVQ